MKIFKNIFKQVKIDKWNEFQKKAIVDGIFYAIMFGFGDKYIVPFALKIGANNLQISILNSLLYLFSGIASVIGIESVSKLRSRKEFISKVSFIQSALWLILAIIPFFLLDPNFVIILYVLNYTVHAVLIPVWISLMGDFTNEKSGIYFGIRTSLIQLFSLISTFIAAKLISSLGINGFIIAFFIAAIARLGSAIVQKNYPDKPYDDDKNYTFHQFVKYIFKDNFGLFVIFQFFFYFSVFFASPFFVPFLLNELKINYFQYAIIINITPIMTILLSPFFGILGDKIGERNVFLLTGLLIPFIPILWSICHNWIEVLFVEFFSGFAWSGFNLATSNFLYTALDNKHRGRGVAYLMLIRSIGIAIGALIAGLLLNSSSELLDSFRPIFIVSGVLRLIAILLFGLKVKEVRSDVKSIAIFDFFTKTIYRIKIKEKEIINKLEFFFTHHHMHRVK